MTTEQTQLTVTRGAREEENFKQVFNTCYEDLCHYACTMLKDMDDAEDIVQTVFLKIWEKRSNLEIKEMRSYLFRAVYNGCINALEHRSVKKTHQEGEAKDTSLFIQEPEVFPAALEERVESAINSLPDQCRLIFTMSRYEELRYAEIAQKLGLSINTIENQISKALKILRTKLKDSVE